MNESNKKKIGFSHGVLHKLMKINSLAAIDQYKSCGTEVLEACFVKTYQLRHFSDIISEIKDFTYKSIHLPTDIIYENNAKTKELLNLIVGYYHAIDAKLAVVHPDTVKDWTVFTDYRINWAVENMDNLKKNFKSVEDIEGFFQDRPNWSLVLDLNHCFTNDPTMKLASEFIERLGGKIAELHLSGYAGYHEPIFQNNQDIIIELCKKLEVPIVIESTFEKIEDLKKEFEYITERLNK